MASKGTPVILVRAETSPEDIQGMFAAKGILTSCGAMTSHAAVFARGMGRPCVCGAGSLLIDAQTRRMTVGDIVVKQDDIIMLDG